MTKSDTIYMEILSHYKKDKIKDYLLGKAKGNKKQPTDEDVNKFYDENKKNREEMDKIVGYVRCEFTDSYDLAMLNNLKSKATQSKNKKFHITDIKNIGTSFFTSYAFGIRISEKKSRNIDKAKRVEMTDMTGIFKISFSDGSFMYYAKWNSGAGKSRTVEGIFATEDAVWFEFLSMIKTEKKKMEKPKPGIFRVYNTGQSIAYEEKKKLQETPIVHPAVKTLLNDLNFYFANVPVFMRYGMPGVRKSLVVGPPGTGKSSFCIKLAKQFMKDKCVVFATSISDVAAHLFLCAKYKVSTIAILEDADSSLQRAESSLLNFLDGVDQPKNAEGAYIIMTTNFPEKIEDRILRRPGRVDKIIYFEELMGADALECAKIYFRGILFKENAKLESDKEKNMLVKLANIVNKMSGAAIKELAQASASDAASKNEDVTVDLVREVKDRIYSDMKSVIKYSKESSQKMSPVGFGDNENAELTRRELFEVPHEGGY